MKFFSNNKTLYNIINIFLVILWMIIVFYFSSEVAVASNETSSRFILPLVRFFNPSLTGNELFETVSSLQFVIRKLAHFVLYMIGGMLLYNLYNSFNIKDKTYKFLFPFITGVFYAMTDEIHQLFVEGRSSEFRDVFIDSLGIITGICIIYLICYIINRNMEGKK